MSPAHDRRGFLRGLASLPLLGGSIALIGAPSAAAVPVTTALLEGYRDWLATEYGETLIELAPRYQPEHAAFVSSWRREWCREHSTLNPEQLASDRFAVPPIVPPSARAAVILSAAGVPLTGGAHG